MKNNFLSPKIERNYDEYFKNLNPRSNNNKGKIKTIFPKINKKNYLHMKLDSNIKNENDFTNQENISIITSSPKITSNGKFLKRVQSRSKEKYNKEKSLNSSKSDYNNDTIKNYISLENTKTNQTNFKNSTIIKINSQFSLTHKISQSQQTESFIYNRNDNAHLKTVDNMRIKKFYSDNIFLNSPSNKKNVNEMLLKKLNRQHKISAFDPEILSFQKIIKSPNTGFCYKKFNEYKVSKKKLNNKCLIYMNNIVNKNNYKNFSILDYKNDYKKFMESIQQKNLSKYLEETKDERVKYCPNKTKENYRYNNIIVNNRNKYNNKRKHTISFSRINQCDNFITLKKNN